MLLINFGLYLLIILSILLGFLGSFVGKLGSIVLVGFISYEVFLFFLFIWYYVNFGVGAIYVKVGTWFTTPYFVAWEFLYDPLSTSLLLLVLFIAVIVKYFSFDYMYNDPHLIRFLFLLIIFTLCMCLLLTASNFIQIFLGWEGVGICSYLLVNFWFTRPAANKSALKALLINRISDCGIFLSLMIFFSFFRTFDFSTIFLLVPFMESKFFLVGTLKLSVINCLAGALFFGAVGKSAQLGLHIWLPDAMEGPTPVSALLHAATMVTAGVFLIIRCSFLFEYAPNILIIISFIGALTTIVAGTIGLIEYDLKKVIAYSTCSQLGYMVCICGFSGYVESFFHLIIHAFFKALLFLCAGNIIHVLNGEQDVRRMGNLKHLLPITYIYMLFASFALAGFPFLSGFYSKDFILEYIIQVPMYRNLFIFWLGSTAACLTSVYSVRLLISVFLSGNTNYKYNNGNAEVSYFVLSILFPLWLGSIFAGWYMRDIFLGLGSNFFSTSINYSEKTTLLNNIEFTGVGIKLYANCLSLISIVFLEFWVWLIPFFFSVSGRKESSFSTISFFQLFWYFDILYLYFVGVFFLEKSYWGVYKNLDKGFLENIGPTFFVTFFDKIGLFFSESYTIRKWLLFFYLCYVFFLAFYFF